MSLTTTLARSLITDRGMAIARRACPPFGIPNRLELLEALAFAAGLGIEEGRKIGIEEGRAAWRSAQSAEAQKVLGDPTKCVSSVAITDAIKSARGV